MKIMPKILFYTGLIICISVAISREKDPDLAYIDPKGQVLRSEAKLTPIPYKDEFEVIIVKPVYQEKIIFEFNSEITH